MRKVSITQATTPTIMAIVGGTGDLAQKKLLPAIFDLYIQNLLPSRFKIVGFARKKFSDEAYRIFVRESVQKKNGQHNSEALNTFLKHISYQQGTFDSPKSYEHLSGALIKIEGKFGQCSNKLFHLAVPPSHYDTILRNLADSGLTIPCSNDTGWTRVLVEKPFGRDIETAKELDKTLGLLFREEQIFRIDHYLGKESLQDILMFRFSNLIFEPIWNSKYIDKVEIFLHEESDIAGRGMLYDGIGALRDVGQNHALQMLAAIGMEHPGGLNAKAIRNERAKVLESLRIIKKLEIANNIIRGQYNGYLNENDVSPNSKTETYFKAKIFIDNKRWKNVPFIIEGGKSMRRKRTEIKMHFKKTEKCLCPTDAGQHHANILTFHIEPDAGISILFWAKKSGFTSKLQAKELSLAYNGRGAREDERIPDAYERILFDAIVGDQMLFTSTEEVNAAWNFITPILKNWDAIPLYVYEKGGTGPDVEFSN